MAEEKSAVARACLEWERVDSIAGAAEETAGQRLQLNMMRAKVPSGWLVRDFATAAVLFLPDPDHEWGNEE